MRNWKIAMSKAHVIVFTCLLVIFSILTFLICIALISPRVGHYPEVFLANLGTICGPMVGAISSNFMTSCFEFSLTAVAICGPFLFLGVLVQFTDLPARKWLGPLRMGLWVSGWLVWFMGGIVSLGYALS
ncbi:MAG: hypothetical protein ABIT37_14035 [Luteolibacter sp.]